MEKKGKLKTACIITAASVSVAAFVVVGFYKPIKKIDINNMSADVLVYDKDICEISDEYKKISEFDKDTLFMHDVKDSNNSDEYASIVIPGVSTNYELGYGNQCITYDKTDEFLRNLSVQNNEADGIPDRGYLHTAVQKDVNLENVSVISVKSDYIFRGFSLEVKKNDGGEGYTLYVKNPRTSIFNNTAGYKQHFVDVEPCNITKVIAVTGSEEKVIYEKMSKKS